MLRYEEIVEKIIDKIVDKKRINFLVSLYWNL